MDVNEYRPTIQQYT